MSDLLHFAPNGSLQFLRERIHQNTHFWHERSSCPITELLSDAGLLLTEDDTARLRDKVLEARSKAGIHAIEMVAGTIVIAPLPDLEEKNLYLISLLEGPATLARCVVENAIECWSLYSQVESAQVALEDSAMQLAQSFEEQNWLRGFARNVTSFSYGSSANEVAERILQPLGYLLRADDVFLIVSPEETDRSGLVSAKYGNSNFTIPSVLQILRTLEFQKDSPPLIRNKIALQTPEGLVNSVVCVVIADRKSDRGFLVAINRSSDFHPTGLPVYEAEFSGSDVGLLEEAAVLLTTQAQNMHLLLQSNELFLGALRAMSSAIDARDPYTQGHSERVARLSFELAEILGLSDMACQEIYLTGILHDIGKIGIPDDVLLKPGELTDEEFAVIQQHPEIGHRIVERLGHLQFTLPGILYHHERWDGLGYPHGLKGLAIPLMARVIAVADSFDAMTSSRPYRSAMPTDRACSIMNAGAGTQWDSEIVACFNQWMATQAARPLTKMTRGTLIPQDSPLEHLAQAVTTLIQ